MAKLTDADGPELVRLLNALMDAAHESLVSDMEIRYTESGSWFGAVRILNSASPVSTVESTLVEALQFMLTQLDAALRQRDDWPLRPKR